MVWCAQENYRQLVGLEEVKWGDEFITTDDLGKDDDGDAGKRVIRTKQTSLSDFLKYILILTS